MIQALVSEFNKKYNLQADIKTRYIDLVSEVGELGKEILQSTCYGKLGFTPRNEIADEIGDCLYTLFTLCNELKIDSHASVIKVLDKYELRFQKKGDIGSGN